MPKVAGHRLYGLQALRFFAALSVLLGHSLHELQSFGAPSAAPEPFYFGDGVDVFFVISGFIMYYVSAGQFGAAGAQRAFLMRRLVRLVPLYWLFSALMVLAVVLVPAALAHNELSVAHVAASLAFVPWLDGTGLAHPILGLGWTLNYEMFFYLAFSCALWLSPRLGLGILSGLFVAFSALHALVDPNLVQLRFWTDPIILEFLMGLGIAAIVVEGRYHPPHWVAPVLLAGGAIGLLLGAATPGVEGLQRPILVGIPAAMLVAGAAFGRFPANGPMTGFLVLGGDASYALYLSHPFSLALVAIAWQRMHLPAGPTFVATAVVVAVAGSIVVHLLFERPLTRWLGDKLTAGKRRPASARLRPAIDADK